MSEELKPCPACGGEAEVQRDPLNTMKLYGQGACKNCGLLGPVASPEADAIAAWNALPRREDAAVLVEALRIVTARWEDDPDETARLAAVALNAYEARDQ